MGSVNLARHYYFPAASATPEVEDGRRACIDWDKLAQTVRDSVKFLDDVVTANKYVDDVPQLRQAALAGRRIGLGIMGLADLFFAMRVRYGSDLSLAYAALLAEWIQYNAMLESIQLAKDIGPKDGPFPAIKGSIFDPENLRWSPPGPLLDGILSGKKKKMLLEQARSFSNMPRVDWSKVVNGIKQYGIRNCALTTVAPTGTIGTVVGVEGYGIEPAFALSYTRFMMDQSTGARIPLKYASPLFKKALEEFKISEDHPVIKMILEKGSFGELGLDEDDVIKHEDGANILRLIYCFVTAGDVSPEQHVKMQATFQHFFSNSISKTVNLPFDATREDVYHIYQLAWQLKCRGVTVYRNHSREIEVISTGKK